MSSISLYSEATSFIGALNLANARQHLEMSLTFAKLEDETKKVEKEKKRYEAATLENGIRNIRLKNMRAFEAGGKWAPDWYDYSGVKLLQKKLKNDNLVRCVFYYAKYVAGDIGIKGRGGNYSEANLVKFVNNTEKLNMMFDDIEIPDGYKKLQ